MAGKRKFPDDVARTAWDYVIDAEVTYRKAKDQSPEQMAAMTAWATAAMAAMTAEYYDGGRGYER